MGDIHLIAQSFNEATGDATFFHTAPLRTDPTEIISDTDAAYAVARSRQFSWKLRSAALNRIIRYRRRLFFDKRPEMVAIRRLWTHITSCAWSIEWMYGYGSIVGFQILVIFIIGLGIFYSLAAAYRMLLMPR